MARSVASPCQALYRFNCSPLLLLPDSSARIAHRRASLFLIKLLRHCGESRRGRSWDAAIFRRIKIFITLSIAHCDWVIYAVNTGDKPMSHLLFAVPRDSKKIKLSVLNASAHRNKCRYARLPIQPCIYIYIYIYTLTGHFIRYTCSNQKSNQITFIVTSPQHKCLGE